MKPPKPRMNVRVHPATDQFMMGVVYAEITKVTPELIYVLHRMSNAKHKFPASWWSELLVPADCDFPDKFRE